MKFSQLFFWLDGNKAAFSKQNKTFKDFYLLYAFDEINNCWMCAKILENSNAFESYWGRQKPEYCA